MNLAGFLVHFLNGLAEASSLFLVAAGLSLIFGVSRIVNFAHGSLYMLGIYGAYSLVSWFGASVLGFWGAVLVAGLAVGGVGIVVEVLLLRRIYRAPEMFQLLATFGLVLLFNDLALWLWGPDDLLGPLAPGLGGSLQIAGRYVPEYDLLLVIVGPLMLCVLWLLLTRTRWGVLIRAATQDREMLSALGVNQAWLFTGVFALGAFLAGLGGALQLPRQPANLALDMSIIGDVFVVVVVGGMGSIPGAYLAALIIAQLKALCIALGVVDILGYAVAFPKLTLVVEFIFMAIVLVLKPWGLLGRPMRTARSLEQPQPPLAPASLRMGAFAWAIVAMMAWLPAWSETFPYATILAQDMLVAVLFAVSLHVMMGLGGMTSFGHAAYFGIGAYAAALMLRHLGLGMEWSLLIAPVVAAVAAVVFGWFCIRLSGVYLAMLTLAFAQIVWSVVYQWDEVTGGSNGMVGIWPPARLEGDHFYWFTLATVALLVVLVRRIAFSPFGYALRASRDSPLRAQAIGIPVKRVQWVAFMVAGCLAGVAGVLFVFSKGGTSPEVMTVAKSVDGLIMVLLGGLNTLAGPVVGAGLFTLMQDYFVGITQYWRALFGLVILAIVLVFPQGVVGFFVRFKRRVES